MKRGVFVFLFCMVLLTASVSAFEFDNSVTYSEDKLTAEFTNAFGLGEDLGYAKLLSHRTVDEKITVYSGQEVLTLYYEVNFFEGYNNGIGEVEFRDMRTGEEVQRNYKIVEVTLPYCEQVDHKNGSISTECTRISWSDAPVNNLPVGKIILGLVMEVQEDDHIDAIWTIAGKKVKRHAEFTEGEFIEFWELTAANADATGITSNGTGCCVFVADSVDSEVYRYFNNGTFIDSFDTAAAGNTDVQGLTNNGTTLMSVDRGTGNTYLWDINDGTARGSWGNGHTSPVRGGGINESGAQDTAMFISDLSNDQIYIVNISGGQAISDWDIAGAGSDLPTGVTALNEHVWVLDLTDALVYKFFDNGTFIETWALNTSNTNAAGIDLEWQGGQFFWVVDNGVDGVYKYGSGLNPETAPVVTLNAPPNQTAQTSPTITFNYTIEDDLNISNFTLFIDGVANTTTIFGTGNSTTQITTLNFQDGTYIWNVNATDNSSQTSSSETRTFTIDGTDPNITLTSPTGDQGTFSSGTNLSLAWTVIDTNLDTCFYDYGGVNTTVTCSSNLTNLTVTDAGATTLVFYANDTVGNLAFKTTSWSYSFAETNVTFNQNVSETSSQFFELNLTTTTTVLSITANLIYNGTAHVSTATCTGDNCSISNTIDVPLTDTESSIKSFFWNFTIFNGTDSLFLNSSTNQQNVSRIHLEQCGGAFTTETLNFTAYDEQNLSKFPQFQFDGTFDFWVGGGSVFRNNSFSQNVTEMTLCLQPNETMKTNAIINYDEEINTSTYTSRFYYLDNHNITNVTQLINLYLLRSAASTSFILKVQDDNLLPVRDALIEIHRFYPGTGEFRLVQIAQTDDNGQSVGFFETEIVDYRFVIKKDGEILLETGQQKVIPETSPFTLIFNTGEDLGEPWKSQNDIPDLNSTLSWDQGTGIVTYTYIDTSTNFTLARLFVQRESLTNVSAYFTICNDNSTLSSATITCDVGNSSGFYIASTFITRAAEGLDKQINFQIETFSSAVGLLGLFYGWFLIVIAAFMFKFNELAGIWSLTITIFLVNIMGLIKFGALFVTAILVLAIMITWLMER